MKNPLSILFFCFAATLFSQPNTEVYLFDLNVSEENFEISNFQNISNNDGYDNQPFFRNNSEILFAKTRNGQTDIAVYNLNSKTTEWFNTETPGGEYSPVEIPNSKDIAAVRLDTNGLQRLYRYGNETRKPSALLENVQVAYYSFYDENNLLATVLSGNVMDLVTVNLMSQKVDTLLQKAGRSLHKVPNSDMMSYTLLNEEGNYDVYQFDMASKESFFVTQLPIGIQDHVWLDDTKLLIGSGYLLFIYDLFGDGDWQQVANLSEYNIKEITRLAVSPDGKKLALVAMPSTN